MKNVKEKWRQDEYGWIGKNSKESPDVPILSVWIFINFLRNGDLYRVTSKYQERRGCAALIELVTVKYVIEASSSWWTRIVPQTWSSVIYTWKGLFLFRVCTCRIDRLVSLLGRWLFMTFFFFFFYSACFRNGEWRKIVQLYFREE